MWKYNHCKDTVTDRDILPMEMLEWNRLIQERATIDDQLHACKFNAWLMDMWRRGMTDEQLYNLYNKR